MAKIKMTITVDHDAYRRAAKMWGKGRMSAKINSFMVRSTSQDLCVGFEEIDARLAQIDAQLSPLFDLQSERDELLHKRDEARAEQYRQELEQVQEEKARLAALERCPCCGTPYDEKGYKRMVVKGDAQICLSCMPHVDGQIMREMRRGVTYKEAKEMVRNG